MTLSKYVSHGSTERLNVCQLQLSTRILKEHQLCFHDQVPFESDETNITVWYQSSWNIQRLYTTACAHTNADHVLY